MVRMNQPSPMNGISQPKKSSSVIPPKMATSANAIDEISWKVGYEDAAFFRRLFKRTTGLAPGAYRKRFRIPEFARP